MYTHKATIAGNIQFLGYEIKSTDEIGSCVRCHTRNQFKKPILEKEMVKLILHKVQI